MKITRSAIRSCAGTIPLWFFLLSFTSILSAAEPDYVLKCKGGGAMTATIIPYSRETWLAVTFVRATAAASVTSPGPGQCAWLDRPIGSDEPDTFVIRAKYVEFRSSFDSTGRIVDWQVYNIPYTGDGAAIVSTPNVIKDPLDWMLSGREFSVRVRAQNLEIPTKPGRFLLITNFVP